MFEIKFSVIFPDVDHENNECITNNGEEGICLPIYICINIGFIDDYKQLKTCGFEDNIPIVCCPTSDNSSDKSKIGMVVRQNKFPKC